MLVPAEPESSLIIADPEPVFAVGQGGKPDGVFAMAVPAIERYDLNRQVLPVIDGTGYHACVMFQRRDL